MKTSEASRRLLPPPRPKAIALRHEASASAAKAAVVGASLHVDDAVRGDSTGYLYLNGPTSLNTDRQPRKLAIQIVESRPFEFIVPTTIVANCVTMAIDAPVGVPPPIKDMLAQANFLFLCLFTCEAVTRLVAHGAHSGRGGYFRSPWLVFEGAIVLVSWVPSVLPSGNSAISTFARSFRALRVMLIFKSVPGMKELVTAALFAIPSMGHVGAVCAFALIVMGCVGVQLFSGALHMRCVDAAILAPAASHDTTRLSSAWQSAYDTSKAIYCGRDPAACGSGTVCFDLAANPPDGSFDSIRQAALLLLQTFLLDSWADGMYTMMRASSPYACIYFISLAILGGFLLLQLFLAVISEAFFSFDKMRSDETEGALKLRELFEEEDAAAKPTPHGARATATTGTGRGVADAADGGRLPGQLRAALPLGLIGRLVRSSWFENVAIAAVCVSTVAECMPFYGEPAAYTAVHNSLSRGLAWFFVAEMVLKLVGLGCAGYWADAWNRIDGILVLISIFEMSVSAVNTRADGESAQFGLASTLRVLRVVRLVRALRVLRTSSMYRTLQAFARALPQVANLVLLLTCVMFVFAIVGMDVFGGTRLRDDSRQHFDGFGPAMLTVLNVFSFGFADLAKACEEQVHARARQRLQPRLHSSPRGEGGRAGGRRRVRRTPLDP